MYNAAIAAAAKAKVARTVKVETLLEYIWVPESLGGHAADPYTGMRLTIRWQKHIDAYLKCVRDVECSLDSFDASTSQGVAICRFASDDPVPAEWPSPRDLALMNRIDRLHLEFPFAGARMLRDLLNDEGFKVGRRHVATLMRKMGIEALYRRPKTTKRHPDHRVYPYLIRNLPITRANQVWAMDITYIPMARGFVYLVVVMDWYSRRILAHRMSITMDTCFCLDAVEEAIDKYGRPRS